MPSPQLKLLGTARLIRPEGERAIDRKPAALLAYLALEGATSRSKLTGLFWPESREDAARTNLRQLVRRVRQLPDVSLTGNDPLHLGPSLEVDCVQMQLAFLAGEHTVGLAFSGDLLEHYDYDDCPVFRDWLVAEREQLVNLRRQALLTEIERLKREGAWLDARAHAEALIRLDPTSEEAYQQLMRLHHWIGDRSAALAAYQRCREALRQQLGVEPLPETVTLAEEIARGGQNDPPPRRRQEPLPHATLRPPVLVGREEAWAQLDAAWEANKVIFISGEAGVGKTRLMLDFAASKGPFSLVAARPGDSDVPYATHARCIHQFLEAQPELRHELKPWVVQELARLVPELGEPPPPMTSAEDKLRHFEAQAIFMKHCFCGVVTNVCDDMQYFDRASFEAGTYVGTSSPSSPFRSGQVRSVNAFRRDELPADIEVGINKLVASGVGVRIELAPLSDGSVRELVESTGLAVPEEVTSALVRHTGGNPLFILETLRSLVRAGGPKGGALRRLPFPRQVLSLIQGRLRHLSADALRLAWVAAVAGTDFDYELACDILEVKTFELAQPWKELERAQILTNGRFIHDLLYEAVSEDVPGPVRAVLHRRCAHHLTARRTHPARIAKHYLDAGDEASARPFITQTGVLDLYRRVGEPR